MSKIPENLFTILEFSDTDGGRIYRGERVLTYFTNRGLNGYEAALDELEQDVQRIYLISEPHNSLSFDSEWKTRSLSDVLTAAADNGADIQVLRESPSMKELAAVPTVTYFGFDPSLSSILTDAKFAEVLEKYGYSLASENGDAIDYSQVASGSVWVYDAATESGIAVIHDGLLEARLTSPGFESILKIMDDFKKRNAEARLFLSVSDDGPNEVYLGDPEFDWEFDFITGRYFEPASALTEHGAEI